MDEFLKLAQGPSVILLLLLIIVGGYRGWWVFGWQYRELRKEMEAWKGLALKGTDIAEQLARGK